MSNGMLPDTCPHCGVDDPVDDVFNIEWNVLEGPSRGKAGTGNVHLCTECGEPIRLSRTIQGKGVER